MAYELEVYPDAEEQIDALPPEVRAALGRAMTVLALVPWNGLPYNDDMPDGSMRQLVRRAPFVRDTIAVLLQDSRRNAAGQELRDLAVRAGLPG